MFLSLFAVALAAASPAAPSHYALLDQHFGAATHSEATKAIIARARTALKRPPGAIPQLHTEGTLPGKGIREISLVAKRDQPIVLDLAMAWRLTGDRAFLDQAALYLDAWARIYRLSFNPIDETGFDTMLMAADLSEADLPADVRQRVDGLWRAMATGYLDAMDAKPTHGITNWQSHRVKLATMAAFQTGDRALIDRARAAYRAQVAANLHADGSTFDFEERDALHYVTYDLEPLLMAALAAKMHGEDWYGWVAPSGASLPRSVAWLAEFACGRRTHVEFANSRVQFDRDRAQAGQGEYAPHLWTPDSALLTYQLAARFDPSYADLARSLAGPREKPGWTALF